MRKIAFTFLFCFAALGFTSCSNNELDIDETPEALLKQIELKRDANGVYSIAYQVLNNTLSVTHNDVTSNTKEIHLSKVVFDTKNQYSQSLALSDNRLSVGLFDDTVGESAKFTIEDDNINFAKGGETKFLKTYGLTTNEDGTLQLDFEVEDNVVTTFLFNKLLGIYEVHLRNGPSTQKVFSLTVDIPITKILKIDFVNHALFGKGAAVRKERKPRVVYDTSLSY
jgi:hypothetical protein